MKRLTLTACAGLLAASMAAPSFAADLPRPAYKAPVYVAPSFNWTGFYVGLNGGYGWGKTNWTQAGISTGDFNTKGYYGGVTLGYNIQTGVWVWGIEGDFDLSDNRGTDTATCGTPGCTTRNMWLGTARARLGYSFNRFLPYLTAGGAYGSIKMSTAAGDEKQSKFGWTAGGGVEYAFLGSWSAKLEYLYVDLGKATCSAATCGLDSDVAFKTHIVKGGLNYRF